MEGNTSAGSCAMCKCPHHKMLPLLIVLFAVLFLLGNLEVITGRVVGLVWPIIVGVAGFLKMGEDKCKCC